MNGKYAPVIFGGILAFASMSLVVGSLFMSKAEQEYMAISSIYPVTQQPPFDITQKPSLTSSSPTVQPRNPPLSPTETQTILTCNAPENWIKIVVVEEETLETIATKYHTSVDTLIHYNCQESSQLTIGSSILVPQLPSHTATVPPSQNGCGAPFGWVQYTIKRGDTLYSLHKTFQLNSIGKLQEANCMGSSTTLITGTFIWVPDISPVSPTTTSFQFQIKNIAKAEISF